MHWYHIVTTYVVIICMITSIPIIVVYMTFDDATNSTATNMTVNATTELPTESPPGFWEIIGKKFETILNNPYAWRWRY